MIRHDVRHTYYSSFNRKRSARGFGAKRAERWHFVDVPVDVPELDADEAPVVLRWRDAMNGDGECRAVHGRLCSPLVRPARYADDAAWMRDVAARPVEGEDDPFQRYNFRDDATPPGPPPDGYEGVSEPTFPGTVDGLPGRPVLVDGRATVAVDEPFILATHTVEPNGNVLVRAVVETYRYGPQRFSGEAFRMDAVDAIEPYFRALYHDRDVRVFLPEVDVYDSSWVRLALDDRALLRGADAALHEMRTVDLYDKPLEFLVAFANLRDAARPVREAIGDDASLGSAKPEEVARVAECLAAALEQRGNGVARAALLRHSTTVAFAAERARAVQDEEYVLAGMSP